MKACLSFFIYQALLPILFLIALPAWLIKTIRRGGLQTPLQERFGLYSKALRCEPSSANHIHAVSVGETAIALKLIQRWLKKEPNAEFVLAVGTATAFQLATTTALDQVRVTYSPLDFRFMVRNYFRRFSPRQVVLIEGEIWPNFLCLARKQRIPVTLANARVSPRSSKRFRKFCDILKPIFSQLSAVCIQEEVDRSLWQDLGLPNDQIHLTGSIKFDPSTNPPPPSPDFAEILRQFGEDRPIILAASTFPGEEELITAAVFAADAGALPVIVPRHAERRQQVHAALTAAGFLPILRSTLGPNSLKAPRIPSSFHHANAVLVIDTTGELATWTSHADLVIIGKSFLSPGGQNPAEAVLAKKPLIFGPHMVNFQPLASRLLENSAALLAHDLQTITAAIGRALDPDLSIALTQNATAILNTHSGASDRHLQVLHDLMENA